MADQAPDSNLTPTVSIVLPTHDRPEFLREAIDSVRRQTFTNWELIVVDDGGRVPAAIPDDPRIRLIDVTSGTGPAAARNRGIGLALGRWITFLDDDDWYTEERLSAAVEAAESGGPLRVVVCFAHWDNETTNGRILEGDVSSTILDTAPPTVAATLVHRSQIEYFDESFPATEDLDWWIRLAGRPGVRLHTVATVGVRLRRHDAPRLGYGAEQRIDGSLRLMAKYPAYFRRFSRSTAYRWYRIGVLRSEAGLPGVSAALGRSLAARPSLRAVNALRRHLVARARSGLSIPRQR